MTALKTCDSATGRFHICCATFRIIDGATDALYQLGDATNQGLVDLENAATLTRATSGTIDFLRSAALPAWSGCGSGAYITGLLDLCFCAGTIDFAERGALRTRLHDVGFEDDDLHALAKELVWGTSLLMAVIAGRQVEAVDDVLNDVAVKIGWAVMNETVADLVRRYGESHPWGTGA